MVGGDFGGVVGRMMVVENEKKREKLGGRRG